MSAFMDAKEKSRQCDLFMVVGSSLVVYPASEIPMHARYNGANLVIVNLSNTDQDHLADLVIRGRAGDIMSRIIKKAEKRMDHS